MKNVFKLLPLAALMLASCSVENDDMTIVNYPEGAIWFTSGIETTRGLTTASNFREFNVTALHSDVNYAFTDLAVSSTNGTTWTYGSSEADLKYWPADNTDVSFFAYAPVALQSKVTISEDRGKKITGFQQVQTLAEQTDVLTAIATGNKSSNAYSGVVLDFKHALSQIEVKAKNSSSADYQIKVKGVKLCRVNDTGDLTYQTAVDGYPTWSNLSGSQDFIKKGDTEMTLTSSVQNIMFGTDNFLMVPQALTAWTGNASDTEGAYLSVLCQIYKKDGENWTQIYPTEADKFAFSAVPINTKWEPGHKYVYTLDFFGSGGGAGQIDPNPTNPTHSDPADPNSPLVDDPDVATNPASSGGSGNDDITGGGATIIPEAKSPITFTVSITDWINEAADNPVIDL